MTAEQKITAGDDSVSSRPLVELMRLLREVSGFVFKEENVLIKLLTIKVSVWIFFIIHTQPVTDQTSELMTSMKKL